MNYKHRAIGIVEAVIIIFVSSLLVVGITGNSPNAGILGGPLLVAFLHYREFKKTTIVLTKGSGEELILSGDSAAAVSRFVEEGWYIK